MPDGGHHPQPDGRLVQQAHVLRQKLRRLGFINDVLQMRQHRAAKVAEQYPLALAVKHRGPQRQFERLDALGQGGLRDVALGRRLGEIERLGCSQNIPDLRHFHADRPAITTGTQDAALPLYTTPLKPVVMD